jgi:hypothetical protein
VGDTSDQARFTEVVLPHLVDAFRLARWIAGSRADAEDIVQDASMRAFKNIRGFSGGDPRAWVLTIVRNTSYSWLAKNLEFCRTVPGRYGRFLITGPGSRTGCSVGQLCPLWVISRHNGPFASCLLYPPEADIRRCRWDVRKVP